MNPLHHPSAPVAWLTLGLLALSCQSGPATSSSSNWVVCELPVDCADVPDAADCVDGYCVDAEGERIERSGSGGASAAGGSVGSGATASGGEASGSGGENLGGAGAGSGGAGAGTGGGAAELTCEDFGQLASCERDEDCTTGERQTDCCGNRAVTGVGVEQEQPFTALATSCGEAYPACGCPSSLYPMTDEGRALTEGEAGVSCVDGQCKSWVGERACGDALTCVAGEICVEASTVLGPTETFAYSCVPNPCSPGVLDCTCAAASCDLDDGHSRLCLISLAQTVDVSCQDQAQ